MKRWIVFTIVLTAATTTPSFGQQYNFNVPSDDRWQYPFNSTPGTRPIGSCFGAGGYSGFNDRDGEVLLGWDTSSSITPGQGAASYNIASVTITLTSQSGATWPIDLSVDEWYTYDLNSDGQINADGIPRGQPGDTDGESSDTDVGRPIELFGMGFGPVFDAESWNEFSFYVGSSSMGDFPRDPFPFVYRDGFSDMLHVEDSVKGLHNSGLTPPLCGPSDTVCPFTPIPWAIGVPVNYTPGAQTTAFDVTFEVNLSLSSGRVRQYFQDQLNTGRVMVAVTSLTEAAIMGEQSGFPSFFMKEATAADAVPARLKIVLSSCTQGDGDINCDGVVNQTDVGLFVSVLVGTDVDPSHVSRSDMNNNGTTNGLDIQPFVQTYLGI